MSEITEVALTESRTLRAQYAGRTYILDRVRALSLLPDDMHATTEMVASYYEVPVPTIESLVFDNREELESNGRHVLKGADLREFAASLGNVANLGLSPKARSLAIFSRRAILNVGQLLTESPIARQVRTYLLEAEAAPSTGRDLTRLELIDLAREAEMERIKEAAARQVAERRVAELEGPAHSWEVLADATGDYSVREAAQILNRDPNISTGQNRLFKTMHDIGWIDGRGDPYQTQVDNGRLVRRTTSYTHPHTGESVLSSQVRVTAKGIQALRKILGGEDGLFAIAGGE